MARLRTKAGTRLTRKVIEEISDEAERGYDLSKAERVNGSPGSPISRAGRVPANQLSGRQRPVRADQGEGEGRAQNDQRDRTRGTRALRRQVARTTKKFAFTP